MSERSAADERPPLAVFDLDGTLVDTAPDLAAALNHCLVRVGMTTLELEVVRPHAGHGATVMLREAYRLAGRPFGEEEARQHLPEFLAYYEEHISVASRLYPGIIEAMDQLEAAGWTFAICTNKYEALAAKLLTELDLVHRFRAVCGADTFPRRKPDPIHLIKTIEAAGGDQRRTIMIGDTITDVDTANAANVPVVLVDFGYAPDAEARRKAQVVLSSYGELSTNLAERLISST